ncbi:hypothetical protein DSO57_1038593 [Entomophthora muscae]|uniref:Uncharacterized protein n=1 Tax=Entomophthora muscae TaxID=34485 RepID=A0ACC2TWS6_9FUNG|nr:hypothetical protein DSO57_1038593 [Entomophthora muscae]
MKVLILLSLLGGALAIECRPRSDHCAPDNTPLSDMQLFASFYSQTNYNGDNTTVRLNGTYGCHNDIPSYVIRSVSSIPSTKIFLHYGRDCSGHVLQEIQGSKRKLKPSKGCPLSAFIKFNHFGKC